MATAPILTADQYLHILASEQQRRFTCRATTAAELNAWQQAFRPELRRMLGMHRIADRGVSDLAPRLVDSVTMPTHIREEWRLTTEPGFELPLFLLRPFTLRGRVPVVITPHGHGIRGKAIYVGIAETEADRASIVDGERDIAVQAVEAGYIAIAPDMRGFADLRMNKDRDDGAGSSCRTLHLHAQLVGRTLIGERAWDISRIIDWISTLPQCDSSKIVVTGNSGGGTATLFAAACDERIAVAMPSCYFSTFLDSIGSIIHCACNYVPGMLLDAEMADVAGLIAPRPFLAIAGLTDEIFPIAAVRSSFARLQTIYRAAGVEDHCALSVGDGGHRFFKRDAWPFVRRHLNLES